MGKKKTQKKKQQLKQKREMKKKLQANKPKRGACVRKWDGRAPAGYLGLLALGELFI